MTEEFYVDDEYDLQEPEFEYDSFFEDLRKLAVFYINSFFSDKAYFCGGPIPKKKLTSPRYLSLLLNLDVCNGMHYIYDVIGSNYTDAQARCFEKQGKLPDDVTYAISLLDKCCKSGIPKCFAVGLTIMYLELCEGHKIAA